MTYEIATIDHPHRLTMSVREVTEDIGQTIGAGIGRVLDAIAGTEVGITGPPYARYHDAGDGWWDVEVGVPVESHIVLDGIDLTELPRTRAAKTTHIGHYDQLPDAVGAVREWIETNAESAGACWEVYWTAPDQVPVDEWRTDILWPIS